MKKINEMV
jgi:hypothetical protein